MTDFASLALKIDSTEVERGVGDLDRLTAAGTRSEQAATGVQRGFDRVTASAGAQRAGMQQLSFQIGDVAQQFALGTSPMVIFAQQGGQVVQALSMMKGGATGLIGFLAGPWGAVIMGAAMVVGTFASKLYDSGDAADTAAKKYRNAADEARGLIGAMNAMALNEKRMNLNKIVEERMRLENKLAGGPGDSANDRFNSGNNLVNRLARSGDNARLQELRWQEVEARNLIGIAVRDNAAAESAARASARTGGSRAPAIRSAREHVTALTAEQKAYNSASKAAEDFMARLEDETAKIGKTAGEIRMMEVYSRAQAAATDEQRLAIIKLGQAREDAYSAQEATVKLEQDRKTAAEEARRAEAAAAEELRRKQDEYNESLRDTINILRDLGGVAGAIGTALGIFDALRTGDASKVGGPIGFVLDKVIKTPTGSKNKDGSLETLGDRIERIFDKGGKFTKALGEMLGAAGQGAMMGAALFGNENKGAQIGGAIGSAIGMAVAGPLGSVVGSVLGSVVGGLFKKTTYGAASITNGTVSSSGNRSDLKSGAGQAGGGIAGAIDQIAERLGGSVGNYSVSVGLTNGNWNVNPGAVNGKIGTKWQKDTIDFKKDQEGAIRWAIANAIQDGAIQGVRQGVNTLLKAGSDIDAQLTKALKFQSVFDDLLKATNPLAYSLEMVSREANSLNKIFAEAGATAEEYAQLEQLLATKRQEAAEQARKDVIDKIREPYDMYTQMLELLGKGEEALAAQRMIELASLKDSLQPLQAWIYQMQDARKTIETFQPLAEDLIAYRAELLGGDKEQSLGYLAAQFRATAIAAGNGDATGLGNLRGAASSFLDAAKENASSALDYQRAQAEVLRAVDKGIFAAETQVDYAQAQLDAINNSARIMENLRAEMAAFQQQITENTGATARILQRFDGSTGLLVTTTQDEPLQVEVVATS